ncbi:hypothetical protein OGAPHI_002144 [Ogataea philodendri]|uniref:Uncharacterized protein n=1 Tax=Ogataea philodendri TaxID=1378263 RepID=A0A9P8T7P3_9ASCO|nr:uncharacterized protein OGAPHI_002144 [Ogataea philodendri]KAH3668390.1 hypothetical protein OGAPHI_002144 [Ogataea philodendri]
MRMSNNSKVHSLIFDGISSIARVRDSTTHFRILSAITNDISDPSPRSGSNWSTGALKFVSVPFISFVLVNLPLSDDVLSMFLMNLEIEVNFLDFL